MYDEYAKKMGDSFLNHIQSMNAIDFLLEQSIKYKDELVIIALAPLTNIHQCLLKDPDFGKRVKNITMLGGTYLA